MSKDKRNNLSDYDPSKNVHKRKRAHKRKRKNSEKSEGLNEGGVRSPKKLKFDAQVDKGGGKGKAKGKKVPSDGWFDARNIVYLLQNRYAGNYHINNPINGNDELQATQSINDAITRVREASVPVVIPVNFGNNHWTSLVIRPTGSGAPQALYADSFGSLYGRNNHDVPLLRRILMNHGLALRDLSRDLPQQSNNYDCGPWTVLNLHYLATTGALPGPGVNTADEIRAQREGVDVPEPNYSSRESFMPDLGQLSGKPNSLIIVYQSLERATIGSHTRRANKTDHTRHKSGKRVSAVKNWDIKQDAFGNKKETSSISYHSVSSSPFAEDEYPKLEKIMGHIKWQVIEHLATNTDNSTVGRQVRTPDLIIFGECGHQLGDYPGYKRVTLFADQGSYERMSCYIRRELSKYIKISELPSQHDGHRPGFLVVWENWRMCFVHVPNKFISSKKKVMKYLNGLLDKGNFDLALGDFNYNPSSIAKSTRTKSSPFQSSWPHTKAISFAQKGLSEIKGTNSVNKKVFDGFVSVAADMFATKERVSASHTSSTEQVEETIQRIIPYGLSNRLISDGSSARAFTDHQGFIFEIISPYRNSEDERRAREEKRIAIRRQYKQFKKKRSKGQK